jgi:hypothetical protein
MVLGLMLSLFVKRRRVWVRVTGTGPTAHRGRGGGRPWAPVPWSRPAASAARTPRPSGRVRGLGERLRQDAPPTEQHTATTAEHDQTTHREQEAT